MVLIMNILCKAIERDIITRITRCHHLHHQIQVSRRLFYNGVKLCSKVEFDNTSIPDEVNPAPEYIVWRQQLWHDLKSSHDNWLDDQPQKLIKITLPNGKMVEGLSWKTTPFEVAKNISHSLSDECVVAKVNGEIWDLERPFERDSSLQLLKFNDVEAKAVFWHSSSHILGMAMEKYYGGHLCHGPSIEEGFYYDMFIEDRTISPSDYPILQSIIEKIIKDKHPFERLVLPKRDLLKMFQHNKFKLKIINEKISSPSATVYRCGPLIDLCKGPHVRNTGQVKTLQITKHSSYCETNSNAEILQRIYGISFPNIKLMKDWQKVQEEAAKRDHRKIGKEQKLFMFHEMSPGSPFFLPNGTHIYKQLCNLIEDEYRKRGFQEVMTPELFNVKLWKTSGHWNHYAEHMFSFDSEGEKLSLKPMNCPAHCLIYDHHPRHWKELPLRIADFGMLHRNEFSGALSGLTRVRAFSQDDAHIFCRPDQIKKEIAGSIDFLKHVYGVFGLNFQLRLSTRPEKFLGDIEVWNEAENQLKRCLDESGDEWQINPSDGAFYGPKIDITILDALKRAHQCATIQLDFQLPERFDLHYIENGEKRRPVIIHRAILGSLERMIAILCEHFAGKWPFWMSPRQCIVIPVGPSVNDYASKVKDILFREGFMCEDDLDSSDTMNKKIRNAQLAQFNFIFVVGEKELRNGTVNVRTRDNKILGEHSIEHILERMNYLKKSKILDSENMF